MADPQYHIDDYLTPTGAAAKPLTPEEQEKDDIGFTAPNLHRRVDPQPPVDPRETRPREYTLGIYDKIHSYRTTDISYHDEESTTCEIP